MIVRQSTARTILVGPILDSTGAAKTDEVVGSIKVTKNGTVGAANGSATLTHDHAGKYKLALTATDCDTVGVLEISLNSGTNDMPVARLCVIEEAVYDAMFAASAVGYQVPIWASAASTVNLSATTVKTLTDAVALPASATIAITGDITGNLSGSVGSVTGLTASNLDATISSRMATYTQPTGFLAATFPGTVASTTNITAGTITTTTNLTNLPAITANWLTAAGLATDAVNEIQSGLATAASIASIAATLGTPVTEIAQDIIDLTGDVGYLLTRLSATRAGFLDNLGGGAVMLASSYTAPDNAGITSIKAKTDQFVFTVANQVDANALSGGGGLDAAGVRSAVGLASANLDTQLADIPTVAEFEARTLVAANYFDPAADTVAHVTLVDTLTTYTGNTPQTGDAYAVVNSGTFGNSALKTLIDAIDTVVDAILADTGTDGVAIAASVCNKIADHVRRRTQANVEASGDGDTLSVGSLYGAIQQSQESAISGTTQTIYKTDGSTSLGTKTVSKTPSDDPIRGIS